MRLLFAEGVVTPDPVLDQRLQCASRLSMPSEGDPQLHDGVADGPAASLHVMTGPVRVLGLFYARCACGFVSEGESSPQRALRSQCPFELAEAQAVSTWQAFQRARCIAG
jgi:hypothetical protein